MTEHRAEELVLTEDRENSRYILARGDRTPLATMDYHDNGRTVTVLRVFTAPPHRGQGYAARLMEHAVDRIARHGDRKVESVCWFASDWFAEHPERQHLLG